MIHMLEAACYSHKGNVRSNNEDNFYFDGVYMMSDNEGLSEIIDFRRFLKSGIGLAVFDGMGGGDYGEIASFLAAEYMKEVLELTGNIESVHKFLNNICQGMNQRIIDRQEELNNFRIGSTVAGLFFHKKYAYAFNLGDSRIYCLRDNELMQISKNHTNEQYLKEHGITGRKPRLLQHLGIDSTELQLEPHIVKCEYKRGDRFLICSDGLTDMVSNFEITDILLTAGNVKNCTKVLSQKALDHGGKDNVTVILCQVH